MTLLSGPLVGTPECFTMSYYVVNMLPVFYRPAVWLPPVLCVASFGGLWAGTSVAIVHLYVYS